MIGNQIYVGNLPAVPLQRGIPRLLVRAQMHLIHEVDFLLSASRSASQVHYDRELHEMLRADILAKLTLENAFWEVYGEEN